MGSFQAAAPGDPASGGVETSETRKRRGAWYTPAELIEVVVDGVIRDAGPSLRARATGSGRAVRVLDPACGDGRFLAAVAARLVGAGHRVELTGCDIDPVALARVAACVPAARLVHADALAHDWRGERFDLVVGNPPYLSQMSATTTRGGSSPHGGGPYADAAVEFLALAVRLADPDGGCIGLVLPQSILATRDAGPVRAAVAERADLTWSWWEPRQRHFDAAVNVCAIGLRRPGTVAPTEQAWTRVVTDRLGIPPVEPAALRSDGTIGDRADLNANFRDEYYALVPAVSDDATGPPLVTSGLIDPGVCHWGRRTVRFAKRDFAAPRVDLSRLTGRFPAWAARKLVPKVLVANQTRVVEAVADPTGSWLPGVPVTTVTPPDPARVWEIAAVLTSPVASALAWHLGGGTGMSTRTVRLRPDVIATLPWPAGDLAGAVAALHDGDAVACARAVTAAHGVDAGFADDLMRWWSDRLPG